MDQGGEFSSVQLLSRVRLFVTPWTAEHQASLSITNSRAHPNPCPLSRWCHPAISSSVVPFSSWPLLTNCPSPLGLLWQKYQKLGILWRTNIYFSQHWRWEVKIMEPADSMSGEDPVPDGCLVAVSPMAEGAGELYVNSHISALILLMRAPSSWPNHLPKAPPPNIFTLGIRF